MKVPFTSGWPRRAIRRFQAKELFFVFVVGLLVLVIFVLLSAKDQQYNNLMNAGIAVGGAVVTSAALAALAFNRSGSDGADSVSQSGIERVFLDRGNEFDDADWIAFIQSATRDYSVLGVANHGYVRGHMWDENKKAIKDALARGVNVSIIWLDPTCKAAEVRDEEENRDTRRDIMESMELFLGFQATLAKKIQPKLRLATYASNVNIGVTASDDVAIVTSYLRQELNKHSPGFVVRTPAAAESLTQTAPDARLARAYFAHLKSVKTGSVTLDRERYAEFQSRLHGLPVEQGSEATADSSGTPATGAAEEEE